MACPVTLSFYLIDALLKHLTNQATFAPPTQLYLALYTNSPGQGNTGPEVSTIGTGYVRQAVAWTAVASHQTSNAVVITFPSPLIPWGTVNFVGLFDAASGGNLLAFAALNTAVAVNTGTIFQVNLNQLVLSFQ